MYNPEQNSEYTAEHANYASIKKTQADEFTKQGNLTDLGIVNTLLTPVMQGYNNNAPPAGTAPSGMNGPPM
ncbi:MAG: hypothetical protein FWF23_03330 [Alphaproteobacteria bacterium]|nr:hypothetical protein [Alphaproteobacteria bacterium]MCL2505661.1 hypothetical protein [Alphaproteobacteria bacterium]